MSEQTPLPPTLSGWADPVLVRRRGRSVGHLLFTWGVILLLALLEAAVLAPLMEVVLNIGVLEAWGIAGIIALVGAVAMHVAGRVQAGMGPERAGDAQSRVVLLVGVWLVLGLVLAVLRVIGLSVSTDITSIGQDSGAGAEAKDLVAAGMFFVLFAISGILAFGMGMDRNDAHEAQVLAEEALGTNAERLTFWEIQLVRVAREVERRQADQARVEVLAQAEREISARVRDAAMGQARTEIGRLKGDPAVTGIASTRHPDHPAHGTSDPEVS